MRVLITGAGGFCARHLVDRLSSEARHTIAGLDVSDPPSDNRMAAYYRADVTDSAAVQSAITRFRPEIVFHLAGVSGGSSSSERDSPVSACRVNLMGAAHLLEAVRENAPGCRVLLVGSAAEYGPVAAADLPVVETHACRPEGVYGVTKHAATLLGLDYARRYGLKVVVARPFNVIGPGIPATLLAGALVARLKDALASPGEPVVKVGGLDSERDFVAAGDAADAYVRMVEGDFWGEVFNICSGRPCSVRAVAELLLSYSPRPVRLEVDASLVRPSVPRFYGSYEKAAGAFGFRPCTTLERAVKSIWESAAG